MGITEQMDHALIWYFVIWAVVMVGLIWWADRRINR